MYVVDPIRSSKRCLAGVSAMHLIDWLAAVDSSIVIHLQGA
jgi:hypothetical protein